MATPYLPSGIYPGESTKTWQQKLREYLQTEVNNYNPTTTSHIGFTGAQRDHYEILPEIAMNIPNFSPWTGFEGWSGAAPHGMYAIWQFAKAMGYAPGSQQAKDLYNANSGRLKTNPSGTAISHHPYVLNSFIAGYIGYCELQKLANNSTTCSVQGTLDNLKGQRRDNFTTNVAWGGTDGWCYSYTPSKNFIYLTPELGQYLHDNALSKVQNALNEYYHNTAYWLTPGFEDAYSENIFTPYYDNNIFLAKAYILKEPREELVKYLDTPMFKAGDLFYIQNLIAAIEASSDGSPTPTTGPTVTTGPTPTPTRTPTPTQTPPSPTPVHCTPLGDLNCSGRVDIFDLTLLLGNFSSVSYITGDLNNNGRVDIFDLTILLGNFGGS